MRILTLFIVSIILLSSCSEKETKIASGELRVYLPADPEKLNPVFNPKSSAREVFQNVFVPMADYHPETLKLYPVLLSEVPSAEILNDSTLRFEMRIRPEAKWTDGKPVTGDDYKFTVKAVLHPGVNTQAWRSLVSFIRNVEVDAEDNQKFYVDIDRSNMLAKEIVSTLYILPRHAYDDKSLLDKYTIPFLRNKANYAKIEADSTLGNFATAFNEPKNYRENLVHAGPYTLKQWESDQYIILEKKEDYWGNVIDDNPFLQGNPERILFKIFGDELTAKTNFESDGMDVMKFNNSTQFSSLKEQEGSDTKYTFEAPQIMRYFYLAINQRMPGLDDDVVRKALTQSLDIDALINVLENQYGARVTGPIHPSKFYHNTSLKPVSLDFESANKTLEEGGWKDTDNDGVRDKEGVNLSFEFISSSSEKATQIAAVLKEGCKEIGIEIVPVQKNPRVYLKEDVAPHKYQIVALSQTLDANLDDLHYRWHTSNASSGGSNITGFGNEESDKIIEEIRNSTTTEERRTELYLEFQKLLFEDHAAIFLYSPKEKIAINKKWKGKGTSKRPGYMLNTFEQVE